MKYIKTYEELDNVEPEVGDYVVCDLSDNDYIEKELNDFISNNIGIIKNIDNRPSSVFNKYQIRYKNVPDKLYNLFGPSDKYNSNDLRYVSIHYIKFYSKSREECITYLDSKNYNI